VSEPRDGRPPAILRAGDAELDRYAMRREPGHARVSVAFRTADAHAARELYFLELAVQAPDDESARQLEIYAYEAFRDADAIIKEHDLDC
jgi:hypothetical protein